MAYTVHVTAEFVKWFTEELTAQERETFDMAVTLLKDKGPQLGRPYADTLKGSAYSNMKELRVAHKKHIALRVAFAFDPNRDWWVAISTARGASTRSWYARPMNCMPLTSLR